MYNQCISSIATRNLHRPSVITRCIECPSSHDLSAVGANTSTAEEKGKEKRKEKSIYQTLQKKLEEIRC